MADPVHAALSAAEAAESGRDDRALEILEESLKLFPESSLLHYDIALVLARLGKIPRAKDHLSKASKLDSADADALSELGRLDIADGRLGAAISHLDEALKRVPGHPASLNNRGAANFLKGRYENALEDFRSAVQADSNLADAWFNLADTCEILGLREESDMARRKLEELGD